MAPARVRGDCRFARVRPPSRQHRRTAAPAPGVQSAGPVADAATYVGRPVEQLQVFVDGQPTTDAAITDLLETHVGRPLAMADVRESIAHLYSLGRFQDVRVDAATSSSGGVSLRFDLVPLRSVQDVEFTGTLGLDKGLLRRTIADRYGARPPVARAADAARTLEALYRDHGYLGAVVRCDAHDGGGRREHRPDLSRRAGPARHRSPT